MLTDEELVDKILKRDFGALGELFKRYEQSFYRLAYRFTGDHFSADDLASEIFLRIYRYLPSFDRNKNFRFWAMKVASNACLDFVKDAQKSKTWRLAAEEETFSSKIPEEKLEDKNVNIQKDYEKKELEERVQMAMLQLPEKYRLVLYFYFWEDLSYDEIAKLTGEPLNTVRTHIKRGKKKLEKDLADLF